MMNKAYQENLRKLEEPFIGKKVMVRKIEKKHGGSCWGLFRSWSKYIVLDQFEQLKQANDVARFVESRGGAYDEASRNRARRWAGLKK